MEGIATTLLTILIAPIIMAWVGTKQEITLKKALAQIEQQGKDADAKRDEARAETQAKRDAEAAWRDSVERQISEQADALRHVAEDRTDWYSWREEVVRLMDAQDERIMSVLKGQCTQMRSDLIHRAHRYLDDLGRASTEEKDAFNDEYEDYCAICEAYGINNSFIDDLARRVMALPEREI